MMLNNVATKKMIVTAIVAMVLAMGATGIGQASIVTNGNFTLNPSGGTISLGNPIQINNSTLQAWTLTNSSGPNNSYSWLYDTSNYSSGSVQLYGPISAPTTGVTNFVGMDTNFPQSPNISALQQTITGLTPGQAYSFSFYWGVTSQTNFSGTYTDTLSVGFGSSAVSSAGQAGSQTVSQAYTDGQPYAGWNLATMTFTANSTSDILSFLGTSGTNVSGGPPFVLLADVTGAAVPEPASMSLTAFGMLCGGAASYLRRRKQAATLKASVFPA